jgi:L,D-transpeptidase-like protein
MPHAIFYMKDGHAIHGSYEVRNLGKPASHGCVRISPQNATILYQLVKATGLENTQVVLNGETLGGEGQVASSQKSKARSGQSALRSSRPRNNYYVDSYAQPQRRCGIFRLRWCGASYGPQGASRP